MDRGRVISVETSVSENVSKSGSDVSKSGSGVSESGSGVSNSGSSVSKSGSDVSTSGSDVSRLTKTKNPIFTGECLCFHIPPQYWRKQTWAVQHPRFATGDALRPSQCISYSYLIATF